MKRTSPTKTTQRRRPPHTLRRMDGTAHWPKTLDQFIWMLLRAGIRPTAIARECQRSLARHRHTRALKMPTPEVLEYSRVLTVWQQEPQYVDERGRPRSLPLAGRRGSFAALVHRALPAAEPTHVGEVLRQYRLISVKSDRVSMLSPAFVPRGEQRAHFFAYTLSALEGIMDTCHSNLTARDPRRNLGCLQRFTMTERFDLRRMKEYDTFLRDEGAALCQKMDAYLQRREVPPIRGRHTRPARAAHVGVGIFGFKAKE
jgi:hypothetical protein